MLCVIVFGASDITIITHSLEVEVGVGFKDDYDSCFSRTLPWCVRDVTFFKIIRHWS
jgi:hypothetical protein